LTIKNTKLIPQGSFCYSIVDLEEGEILDSDAARFGKDLREFAYGPGRKEVLCPYWRKTNYGMVRCEYLNVESLLEDEAEAYDLAIQHYGTREQAIFDVTPDRTS